MDMSKYRALFIEESREHLAELSRLLVTLETSDAVGPLIDEVFRHAHSIKGMAGSMGYDPITALAHRLEDVVDTWRKRSERPPKEGVDLVLRVIDAFGVQVDEVAAEKAPLERADLLAALSDLARAPEAAAVGERPAEAKGRESRIVRVRITEGSSAPTVRAFLVHRRLAELVTVLESQPSLAELKLGRMPNSEVRFIVQGATDDAVIERALLAVTDVDSVRFDVAEPSEAPKPGVRSLPESEVQKSISTVRVRTEVLDGLIDSVGELFIARERLWTLLGGASRPEVRAALDGLSARIREIHDQVMAVRMMPMRTLTDRYPRLVRDLARSLGKDVELEVQGGEIELDRAIIDNLDALFIHALRNAVDHGIEDAAVRKERQKVATGKIRITATRDRDMVLVVIEDDGRGLDPEELRRIALARSLITAAEAEVMTARDSYFLVCLPGFSTKDEVSDVSGRGVGMDAVRSKIESLGGSLDIESELGRGARFVFRLPLSLAIIPVLLVEAGKSVFAIPVAKVVSVRERGEDVIRQAGGKVYVNFRHALVNVLDLAELLSLLRAPPSSADHVVVIEDGRDLMALGVSRIVGYHEVVVKPLGDPLERLEWFSGAAVLGDGQPILILDLPRALRQRSVAA